MYSTKEQDFQKRKAHKGSYSRYNKLYSYLMAEYEPAQLKDPAQCPAIEDMLYQVGHDYDMQLGKQDPEGLAADIKKAMASFIENDKSHGDTGDNFGKMHNGRFDNIKRTLEDLHW